MRETGGAQVPADRTIVIEGPFQTDQERDDHWAQATIETQGRRYLVAAVIPGPSDFHHFFGMTEEEREEARGWFALVELARCSTRAFESGPSEHLPAVEVRIAQAPALHRWVIADVLHYVRGQLREYALKREGSSWQARPTAHPQTRATAHPQARPTADSQARPAAHPVQQPRLRPQPAASGRRKPAGRDQKLSRPVKIIYDREEDLRPTAGTAPKKSGIQTFLDSLGGIIKNLRRA